jgi:hypothetical protein
MGSRRVSVRSVIGSGSRCREDLESAALCGGDEWQNALPSISNRSKPRKILMSEVTMAQLSALISEECLVSIKQK